MKFGTFLLRVDGTHDATLDDLKKVCEIGKKTFQSDGQKIYMSLIQTILIKR